MRVDTLSQIAQVYQPPKATKTNKTSGLQSMGRDQVQISSAGRDFQIAKQAVEEASDIREDTLIRLLWVSLRKD